MHVALLFIDGLGLGKDDYHNPFFKYPTPNLERLLGAPLTASAVGFRRAKVALAALDTTLGVEGLPQSATGQTTLFSGVNAAKAIGRHLRGFPDKTLKEILKRHGIFKRLLKREFAVDFLNAYRPSFFKKLQQGLPGSYSCSTMITHYAGLRFHSFADLEAGEALYADMTNKRARKLGFAVKEITPQEAGKRLAALIKRYHFSLYEYYLTDLVGHGREDKTAEEVVRELDHFIGCAVENAALDETCLIITSDHGNFEDISGNDHTLNPVPALLIGSGAERIAPKLRTLEDVLPAVLELLDENG
ncbi:MAG: alkaline phosphatase family protein [Dethiobacteria bacterium]|jgi:2,3-bisphosphoglycerate-independent phosphoglycerate mutase